MAVYLVRSFRTYARIRSLTTGTFNLVVKDRIAFRLSGAHPGLDGPAFFGRTQQERIRLSSKLYNHIVRVKPCQPAHPTAFPRVFHTRNLFWIGRLGEQKKLNGTQRYGPPLGMKKTPMTRRTLFAQYRSGRQKIEKRS
jgi:hypothetical protein